MQSIGSGRSTTWYYVHQQNLLLLARGSWSTLEIRDQTKQLLHRRGQLPDGSTSYPWGQIYPINDPAKAQKEYGRNVQAFLQVMIMLNAHGSPHFWGAHIGGTRLDAEEAVIFLTEGIANIQISKSLSWRWLSLARTRARATPVANLKCYTLTVKA